MKSITATDARASLFRLIKKIVKGHRQMRITSKEGSVIVLSEEDYESLMETAELLTKPGMLQSIRKAKKEIREGKTYSMKEVFGDEV